MQIETNWLITSPGRTGGRLIAEVISKFYEISFGVQTQYLDTYQDSAFDRRGHWQIYHSHDPTIISRLGKFGGKILNTRNMIQAALSYCILDRTKVYHVYPNGKSPTPEKYVLDPAIFMKHYEYQVLYYEQVRELIDDSTIIIDYDTIMQGTLNILDRIGVRDYYLYNIREKILNSVPAKNGWRPQDWIANWDEIQEVFNPLEYDPYKILQKGT